MSLPNSLSNQKVPQPSPASQPGVSRMRQRFNELVDDAFSLFNSDRSNDTYTVEEKDCRDGEDYSKKLIGRCT
ncbi:unnamed protein product [Plutella xylostella]|uniref:(diamondback moth) hypothetical protein n=1 Tax=Plutella xylostella TaxID=51655 RepID=A0A8S4FQ59_PLUXY|nr:unnamed protein product [Plutella xylostella]